MERFDTLDRFHAWYEHWHRYHWIAPFLVDKQVADMACGEGYGSTLLSQVAKQVIGIDLNPEVIQAATEKYQACSNLTFKADSVLKTHINDSQLDAVVSFETLEHLVEHDDLMTEFKRVLKADGVLVISTPDKAIYSGDEHHNEFHVKELYADEFKALIGRYFENAMFFGQSLQTVSSITTTENSGTKTSQSISLKKGQEFQASTQPSLPTYLIAVASDQTEPLQPFKVLGQSVLNDIDNELYQHYEQQVKNLLSTDRQLIHAQQKLAALEKQLNQQRWMISELQARLGL